MERRDLRSRFVLPSCEKHTVRPITKEVAFSPEIILTKGESGNENGDTSIASTFSWGPVVGMKKS